MFGNVSNLANSFDLAAIYADQQRNPLESIFNYNTQLVDNSADSSPSANLNYFQSQVTNLLFIAKSDRSERFK